ncbi:MAG: cobalt transporter [Alphaproteobacteria bacterium]|nr:cobalt transporter [Alphaproteobacteria bacterium]
MFRRIITAALIAGAVAGLVATGLQTTRVWPLILAAETFEDAAPTQAHHHGATTPMAAPAEAWAPSDGTERMLYTLLFNLLAGFGFALLVNAGLALSQAAGRRLDSLTGLLWGCAGFAGFALAPALGLPPELPGMPAAELFDRQVWWLATVLATLTGIGLIALPRNPGLALLGLALIAAPHIVGAPHPMADETSRVPAALAASFVSASLATAAVFWLTLGALSGWLQRSPQVR